MQLNKHKSPLLLLSLLMLSGFTQAQAWQPSNVVIMISMDGMRYDYPDKGDFLGLKRMQREGLRVQKMLPTFPSNTFPSHVSLATGTTPEKHGIIDNSFYDKKLRKSFNVDEASQWLEAEPLWISVERQQKKSAVYYWVGSDAAWNKQHASYFKAPFKAVSSEQEKVDQIIDWLDMPIKERPSLIMSYWHGADSMGHVFGPDSSRVISRIAKQDKFLQRLQKALDDRNAWSYVTLILVSDHGMTKKGEAINIQTILKQGGFSPYINKTNAIVHLNFKHKSNISKAFDYLKKQKEFNVYYPKKMPNVLSVNHTSRSGDLVLLAKKDYWFASSGFSLNKLEESIHIGGHGFSPLHPDMAAIFFAQGRGVKKGSVVQKVNMIDVAPSVSALLDIKAPMHSQGVAFLPNL
jgi:predicted AlkP superfamily pyrophosphatase or phosphodiesterase